MQEIHIDLGVLLAVILWFRLRRRTQARSRNDELATVVIALVFGIVVAKTAFGVGVMDIAQQIVSASN